MIAAGLVSFIALANLSNTTLEDEVIATGVFCFLGEYFMFFTHITKCYFSEYTIYCHRGNYQRFNKSTKCKCLNLKLCNSSKSNQLILVESDVFAREYLFAILNSLNTFISASSFTYSSSLQIPSIF